MKYLEKPIIVVLLLLVLSGYLYFFQLNKFALTDPDETFYAQTAKEMVQKGEWLTPQLYGKPQFEKPILFYSFLEASYRLFGINEFASRFPSALFAFLGLVAIYLLGRLFFNNRVGLFSALILATNIEYLALSIGCVTDMMLFTFLLLGVLFFFYGHTRKKDLYYILSAAAFAFATLTKGPVFILLPGFIIALYLLWTKDLGIFKKVKTLIGAAAVFALIALPWYLIMYKLHRNVFMDEFFGFHNLTRFMKPEHKTGSQFYYNIPVIFAGFFPWSAFLPAGLWRMFKDGQKKASIFVLLWLAVIFVFFSVSSTKLPTYIFPCFISLALIVGRFWDEFLTKTDEKKALLSMNASYYFLIIAVALSLIGGYIFIKMDSPEILPGALVSGLFMALGMGLSLTAFVAKRFLAAFVFIVYSVGLILFPVASLVLPGIEEYESSRPVSKIIMAHYKKGDVIGSEQSYRPGVAFYTGVIPAYFSNSRNLSEYTDAGKTVWGVLKRRNIVDEKNRIAYRYGKKCLVTNSKEAAK